MFILIEQKSNAHNLSNNIKKSDIFRTAFGCIKKSIVNYDIKRKRYDRRKPTTPIYDALIIKSLQR